MGLSYGKYMALVREGLIRPAFVPDVEQGSQEKEKKEPQEERRCVICGSLLPETARRTDLTCSTQCSSELNRKRNRESYRKKRSVLEDRPCARCGKIFTQTRKGQRFCDATCQISYNRTVMRRKRNGGDISEIMTRNYGAGVCRVCGKEFQKHSHNHSVCSWECRNEMNETRRRKGLC